MALTPLENWHWWNKPLHRMEIGWITVAFLWGIFMFGVMIYWHVNG